MRGFLRWIFVVGAGLVWGSAAYAAADYGPVIEIARQGHAPEALPELHRLYEQNPYDTRLVYDYLSVSSWAGDDARTIALYETLSPGQKPAYVLDAAAKSYRNVKDYGKALSLYREGRAAYPDNVAFAAGEIMVLADSGLADDAIALAERQASGPFKAQPEMIVARGYAYEAKQDYLKAVQIYQDGAKTAPGNKDIQRSTAFALGRAQVHGPALEQAMQNMGNFTPAELRQMQGQEAAELVRLGGMRRGWDRQQYEITDRAIEKLNGLITAWQGQEGAEENIKTARFDRMVAYRDRTRMKDVIREYEALKQAGIDVPVYAVHAAADAYLYERRPRIAAPLYKQVIAATPEDNEAQIGLFYAYVEGEDFNNAYYAIEKLNARQPPLPDGRRLRTETIAARLQQYTDNLAEAQRRVEKLAHAAPDNAEIRSVLGDIYAAQGWPQAADRQYKLAQKLDPENFSSKIGDANNQFQLRNYPLLKSQTKFLTDHYPDNKASQRLAHSWDVFNRPELLLRFGQAFRSTNEDDLVGRGGLTVSTRLYAPPIAYHYRPYAGFDYASDKLRSGTAESQRYVAGLEYRARNLTLNGELNQNIYSDDGNRTGAMVNAAYDVNDIWQIGGRAELFSYDTPLRALEEGITANGGSLFAVYKPFDARRVTARLGVLDFSDDNVRTYLSGSWVERVQSWPHVRMDWHSNVWASHNDKDNALYFNPENDFAVNTGPEFRHILYRDYDFVYDHRLSLQPGYYWQSHFDSGFSGNLTYQHRIRTDEAFNAGLGISLGRQLYDGEGENSLTLFGDMDWKF